jgi:hypothetical protein
VTQTIVKTEHTNFISKLLKSPRNGPLVLRPSPVDVRERSPDHISVEVIADKIEVPSEALGKTVEGGIRRICLDPNLGEVAMMRGLDGDLMVAAF